MDTPTLTDRLAAHRTLASVPRDQLAWIAEVGYARTFEPGDALTTVGGPVLGLYIILEGHVAIRVDRGGGARTVMEWHGGDVTGMLPYSRLKSPPGSVIAEQPTEIFVVETKHFSHMIRECHELTAVLVHVMLDRARVFKSSELLDEKMASLGRLAAGLAHELNNPASAVARSAKTLVAELGHLDEATKRFCALNLSDAQCDTIAALRDERTANPIVARPIEIADRQDAITDWLDARDIADVEVEPLAEAAFGPADLDRLSETVGADKISTVLAHISTGQTVRRLASEINTAASRIHHLVAAVKGFTYVNQQATLQPIAIGRGLSDTLTVLGAKARSKAVEMDLVIAPSLPCVDGYGGELNQVWANLIDNAIDATPRGHVRVTAGAEQGSVVVRVIDDGPGIPPDVVNRVFDPFFTTKDIGEGTGLGLDIARRIVQRHRGRIDLHTGQGGTEFIVTLPVSSAKADSESRT